MELKEALKCKECHGNGEYTALETVSAGEAHLLAPVGVETCENCQGSGEEPDEEIVVERIIENLTADQEDKLQKVFMEEGEIGGIPICKDNCEDLFENWLGTLLLEDLTKILK